MSKIRLCLSYKNILILKHSLEKRIEGEKEVLDICEVGPHKLPEKVLQQLRKDHEEHKRCLEALIKAMADGGYRYVAGQESNIFGDKYLEKYNEKFKK